VPTELEKVQPGQPWQPNAPFHNAAVETIRTVRDFLVGNSPGRNIYNPSIAMVRNDSGGDRDQHDVLGIGDSLVDPATRLNQFKTQRRVKGLMPSCHHWGKLAILIRPLKEEKIGPAIVAGLSAARIRMNHAEDDYAEICPGDPAILESCTGGGSCKIKQVAGTSGVQWGIVAIDQCHPGFGVELAQNHPGRSLEFNVWVGRWDAAAHDWEYDRTTTFRAIDHRYDVPYPAKCSTGLAKWQPSEEHGRIAEIWALDCSSPGCYGYGA